MKPSRGIFVSEGSPAAESRDAERGTRAALSVLVCIRFAFGFNQSDIFRKIENGGFDQFVQAVRINGKSFFLQEFHNVGFFSLRRVRFRCKAVQRLQRQPLPTI